MVDQHPFVRAAQPVADAVQDVTGWTCHRQAAAVATLEVALAGATGAASLDAGTLPWHPVATVGILLCAPPMFRMARTLPLNPRPGTRYGWATAWRSVACVALATAAVIAMARWMLAIPWAAGGDLPSDLLAGLCAIEACWAIHQRRRDRAFLAGVERGELPAPQRSHDPTLVVDILFFAMAAGANLPIHRDLPSALAAATSTALLASSLLGRCTPRPPRPNRKRSRAPEGFGAPA